MVGITPTLCMYNSVVTIDFPIYADTEVEALSEEFALPCGYYVEYEW